MTRAIVTAGFGSPTYIKGVKRLRASVEKWCPDVPVYNVGDDWPDGCPTHAEVPFAFKPYGMVRAWRRDGHTSVVWLDSCTEVVDDTTKFWDRLEHYEYYLTENGFLNGEWCSDAAVPQLGTTREEMMRMPHLHAGIIALDLRRAIAQDFLERWLSLAYPGGPFCGAWHSNEPVSDDPRVQGHRHDQTVASTIAWQMRMHNQELMRSFYAYEEMHHGACFLATGVS